MSIIVTNLPADNLESLLFSWRTGEEKIPHCLYKVHFLHIHCKSPVAMFWLEKTWKQTRWIRGKATESMYWREAKLLQKDWAVSSNPFLYRFRNRNKQKSKQKTKENLLQKFIISGDLIRKKNLLPYSSRKIIQSKYYC